MDSRTYSRIGSTALHVDPESACKAGRKSKPSVSSPGPAALLCCRKFQIACTRFAHLVHETKLTSLVVALDEKSFFNRRGVLQTNLAPSFGWDFLSPPLSRRTKKFRDAPKTDPITRNPGRRLLRPGPANRATLVSPGTPSCHLYKPATCAPLHLVRGCSWRSVLPWPHGT